MNFYLTLDFQDGISHQAAKPNRSYDSVVELLAILRPELLAILRPELLAILRPELLAILRPELLAILCTKLLAIQVVEAHAGRREA